MIRKITTVFTAVALSMSINLAVPVGVTAVSSLTVVPEAQAGFFKTLKNDVVRTGKSVKRKAKKVKRVVKRNCFSGHQGICGRAMDPKCMTGCGRIGDPVRAKNSRDHRS